MSYKVEVKADSTGTWCGNALAFASQQEALDYGKNLAWRWTAVREIRAVQDTDLVNSKWVDGRLVRIEGTNT